MSLVKKVFFLAFTVVLISVFGISDTQVNAAELESDLSPLAFDTWVSITPKTQTKYGSSQRFTWTTNLSGGDGRYHVTFSYGDGSRSTVRNHPYTSATWRRTFHLASGETQRIFRQEAVANSSGLPGSATATSTLKRY